MSDELKTNAMPSPAQPDFWSKVKYAFHVEDESNQKFSEEELALLNKVADIVVRKRLTAPAMMFLESVRPLNFLGSQAMIFFQPIVSLVVSTKEVDLLAQILERRSSIPLFIELIEKRENSPR